MGVVALLQVVALNVFLLAVIVQGTQGTQGAHASASACSHVEPCSLEYALFHASENDILMIVFYKWLKIVLF